MNAEILTAVLRHLGGGLLNTLALSLGAVLLATLVGVLLGTLATTQNRALRLVTGLYVDVFRGVPSLLILLFVFFALPQLGFGTDPFTSTILGLGLWTSANILDTVRASILSISPHQTEAARALGMGRLQTMVFVIIPQALKRFLPPYIGQITVLIQATALASIVGVSDLLGAAREMMEMLTYSTGESHAILIYGMVLLGFFLICYPFMWLASRLERKHAI